MTFSIPSAARYLSLSKAADSPPLDAQLTPMSPDLQASSGAPRWFICFRSTGYISFIAITASTFDSGRQMGCLTAVIFAGHGVIKNIPISEESSPVFACASLRAIRAAVSMGELSGKTCGTRCGKQTLISRQTAGHAEDITGRGISCSAMYFRVASLTSSAPLATSNTSSKPSILSAVMTYPISSRLLNCP